MIVLAVVVKPAAHPPSADALAYVEDAARTKNAANAMRIAPTARSCFLTTTPVSACFLA